MDALHNITWFETINCVSLFLFYFVCFALRRGAGPEGRFFYYWPEAILTIITRFSMVKLDETNEKIFKKSYVAMATPPSWIFGVRNWQISKSILSYSFQLNYLWLCIYALWLSIKKVTQDFFDIYNRFFYINFWNLHIAQSWKCHIFQQKNSMKNQRKQISLKACVTFGALLFRSCVPNFIEISW